MTYRLDKLPTWSMASDMPIETFEGVPFFPGGYIAEQRDAWIMLKLSLSLLALPADKVRALEFEREHADTFPHSFLTVPPAYRATFPGRAPSVE